MRLTMFFGVLMLLTSNAFAQEKSIKTGNDFQQICQKTRTIAVLRESASQEDQIDALICGAHIDGFMGGLSLLMIYQPTILCPPDGGLPNGQVLQIGLKWMDDHPAKLHENAAALLLISLMEAFPCREGPPRPPKPDKK